MIYKSILTVLFLFFMIGYSFSENTKSYVAKGSNKKLNNSATSENVNNLDIEEKERQLKEKNKKDEIFDTGDKSSNTNGMDSRYYYISLLGNANTKDIFLGISLGVSYTNINPIILRLSFYIRPYEKTVFVENDEKDNYYYQMKETRYVFALELEKNYFFPRSNFGIFASAGFGPSIGDFSGTDLKEENNLILMVAAGVVMKPSNYIYFKIGYQYMDIPYVPDNRGFGELGVLF